MTTRRHFLKVACMSGVCLCGFGSLMPVNAFNALSSADENTENVNRKETMMLMWIMQLLDKVDENLNETQIRAIIKTGFIADFQGLGMNNVLEPYIGHLEEFIQFLEKEWGWKISYENNNPNIIIANENKPKCVCPLLKNANGRKYPALCYCSEGFADQMFSIVTGRKTNTVVSSSIQRGDEFCVYRIELM